MNDEFAASEQDAEEPLPGRHEPAPTGDETTIPAEEHSLLDAHRELIGRYRVSLLASDPAIPRELVVGDTAEEIDASFEAARKLVAGIRESVRREQIPPVPAGAPGRGVTAPSSAYDKIRSGLARLAAS